jgi:hypothetical protein
MWDSGKIMMELADNLYGAPFEVPLGSENGSGALEIGAGAIRVTRDDWSTRHFNGEVYCAKVPGGVMLVRGDSKHTGFWSGNSELAGIDVRVAYGAKVGSDGKIYRQFRNRRTGELEWLSPSDLTGKTVQLAGS